MSVFTFNMWRSNIDSWQSRLIKYLFLEILVDQHHMLKKLFLERMLLQGQNRITLIIFKHRTYNSFYISFTALQRPQTDILTILKWCGPHGRGKHSQAWLSNCYFRKVVGVDDAKYFVVNILSLRLPQRNIIRPSEHHSTEEYRGTNCSLVFVVINQLCVGNFIRSSSVWLCDNLYLPICN